MIYDNARNRKLDGQTAGRLLDQLAAKAKCDPDTALSYILGTLSDKKLDQILPKKYSKARAQATANELVKYKTHTHSTRYIGILTGNTLNRHINERLSLARCLNIKTRNMLSRRGWNRLRRYLSFDWDVATGNFFYLYLGNLFLCVFNVIPPPRYLQIDDDWRYWSAVPGASSVLQPAEVSK